MGAEDHSRTDADLRGAIKYGLVATPVAVAAIAAMQGLGNQLKTTFNTSNTKMAASSKT